jgi:hypothetical protein
VTQPDEPLELFDFRDPDAVNDWAPIDDRVMGGLSRSRLRHDPAGHAVFEGEVSMERNGGFASVRSRPGERGRPEAEACLIELRGDNKQFKLSLLTDDGFDSLNHQAWPGGLDSTPSGPMGPVNRRREADRERRELGGRMRVAFASSRFATLTNGSKAGSQWQRSQARSAVSKASVMARPGRRFVAGSSAADCADLPSRALRQGCAGKAAHSANALNTAARMRFCCRVIIAALCGSG